MNFHLALRLLGVLLLALACQAQAEMYKCKNERGVVQYTDKPGPNCTPVDIRGSPPISGSITPPGEDLAKDEAAFRKRQIEREEGATKDRQAQLERCNQLRREQATLNTSRRVVRMNEKGEPTFVDDAARDQRLADLQRELARCP